MNIYITEPKEIHTDAVDLLKKQHHTVFTTEPNEKESIEVLFIRTYTQVDENYLREYPNVKYILRAGVGVDNIDMATCQEKGITVLNAPASNANSVAEFVVCLMLMLIRNIDAQRDELQAGGWRIKEDAGTELKGKVIGLIGCGAIGKILAKKLTVFEVKTILGYDPYLDKDVLTQNNIEKSDLEKIFKEADIISLHLPLTLETKGLVSLDQMKQMKKTSYLINTSRGGIVSETDLIQALKKNYLRGAALDVFEQEPQINKELLKQKNIITTPHIAGFTKEAEKQMSLLPVERFLEQLK